MIKLLVLDLDGTLYDTRDSMAQCGNYALRKMGIAPVDKQAYALVSGAAVEEFCINCLKNAGIEQPVGDECALFLKYYEEEQARLGDAGSVPFEGLIPVLKTIRDGGVKLAVFSNKPEGDCRRIIENTIGADLFEEILGCREGVIPKPDPTELIKMCAKYGVEVPFAAYAGDTEFDMKTGKNAGVYTIAVGWGGYRTRQTLEAYEPDLYCEKPVDLLKILS